MDWEESQAISELLNMTRDQLDKVDYDLKRWPCQCKKCTRGTRIRDYGISPWYYWPANKKWIRLDRNFFMCSIHWKFSKRLLKSFDLETVYRRIVDYSWNRWTG